MILRLGVLISGGGTTMVNLHEAIEAGHLKAKIACVISSRRKAPGITKAQDRGYPTHILGRKGYDSDAAYSAAIDQILDQHQVDLVVLAGFLRRYLPPPRWSQRCINIHPALLPAFGGKGFYGRHVHEAVWQKGCKISGCTVHLVTNAYDQGPIIVQKAVAINHRDDPDSIARKVFALECQALPEAIGYFAANRIRFENGRAIIE